MGELLVNKGDKSTNVDKVFANIEFDDDILNVTATQHKDTSISEKQVSKVLDENQSKKEQHKELHFVHINADKEKEKIVPDSEKEQLISEDKVSRDIDNLRIALHAIEANQIEKESQIDKILNISLEIKDKLCDISGLKHDISTVKDSLKGLETMIESKFEKITTTIQKQSHDVNDNIPKMNFPILENQITQLKTDFSEVRKTVTEEMQKIETSHKVQSEKLDNEISSLKDLTLKLQHKALSDSSESTCSEQTDMEEVEIQPPTDVDPNCEDLWIMGTSVIKDLKAKKMYIKKKVRITTLQDKTVTGARNHIKNMKTGKVKMVKAKNIMLQLGSNDLESQTPDDVIKEIECLVGELKAEFPDSKLIIGELLPRYYRDKKQSAEFEEKRLLYNALLKDYCFDIDVEYVKFNYLYNNVFYDGIHLNTHGIGIYVKCLKEVLNPLLGMHSFKESRDEKQSSENRSGVKNQSHNNVNGFNSDHLNSRNRYMYNQSYFNRYNATQDDRNREYRNSYRQSYPMYNQNSQNMYYKQNGQNMYNHQNSQNMYNDNQLRYNSGNLEKRFPNHVNFNGYGTNHGQYMARVDQNHTQKPDKERIFNLFEQMLRSM